MDDFVRNKLSEWGLSMLIETFKDQEINEGHFYNLEDEEIKELIPKVGPRKTFKRQFKLLKETLNSATQVLPSTSEANDTRNMDMDPREESSQCQSPSVQRKRYNSAAEESIMWEVKDIMKVVQMKLQDEEKTELNDFLKNKISDLETRKRKLVGVFGRTGAGKSSLINAIVGEKNLLPSGSVCACTSVTFKVEANNDSKKYDAEIEFIKKEDWKEELWFYKNLLDDDDDDAREKLTALYREDWKSKSVEELMDRKYFREIPEFLTWNKKTLKCESAEELSDKIVKYVSASNEEEDAVRQYWPLVECVTVRLPNKDLLQHVTLVDLPGNGDRNKSRDNMWKKMVGSCSTVWIVADINRAVAEKEAWEILQNANSLMGNGGECQRIHFICTKSDDVDDQSGAAVRDVVLKRNQVAKRKVNAEFKKQYPQCSKQFSFEVFTVSRNEFIERKHLQPDETEIPKLRDVLQSLNNNHSEALNYVSGARGILSLIQGTRCRGVADSKMQAFSVLEEKMRHELKVLQKTIDEIYRTFEQCLTEGVEESQHSCKGHLKSLLHPPRETGSGFHNRLKFAVMNNGVFKAKNGRKKNINMTLSSELTGSIDEEFRKTFPNEDKSGPFNGAIDLFSLDTEGMIKTYKDVDLQMHFLKTEEDKLKTKLKEIIREDKKTVYSSLTATIEENMQKCYTDAATITGTGSLENMRRTIQDHVHDKKDTMFQMAKDNMLKQLKELKGKILKNLEETLMKSIELSLETDDCSFPDVSGELDMVETFYSHLEANPNPN
ncbi:nuclear GTPase SLIP-GC-like isoform X1 [Hippoglossus hippoglossus]|uniref:nuclear GTPase SLIP-GC-like isoform X1 n=2 Tax=Hippoglossus hippoglossus TaxID=8267 RepID=UPI00148BCA82|nr:nuclear GTPase SLIP-GC-like isoform X1 [Hippoglossus hippoglossus]XP_034448059.1 nuclear GTPase SLIP-GC-like isoform X1 [Hippoglossus hippoglossus]